MNKLYLLEWQNRFLYALNFDFKFGFGPVNLPGLRETGPVDKAEI